MKNPLDQILLIRIFKSLANPIRLDIISELQLEPQTVSELVHNTGHEQSHLSHNIKMLFENGLIERKKKGKTTMYAIKTDPVAKLLQTANQHSQNHPFSSQKEHTHKKECSACINIPKMTIEQKSTSHLLKSHTCTCKACKKNTTNISKTKNIEKHDTNHSCHCQACAENQYFSLKYCKA
jgi:DNA-binding transcriptional ArsR family regulator